MYIMYIHMYIQCSCHGVHPHRYECLLGLLGRVRHEISVGTRVERCQSSGSPHGLPGWKSSDIFYCTPRDAAGETDGTVWLCGISGYNWMRINLASGRVLVQPSVTRPSRYTCRVPPFRHAGALLLALKTCATNTGGMIGQIKRGVIRAGFEKL